MCRNVCSIALRTGTASTLLVSALLVLTGCTLEMVANKPVGGCSQVTMQSIDDALIQLMQKCDKKEIVK